MGEVFMKKILNLVLMLTLCSLLIAGCGNTKKATMDAESYSKTLSEAGLSIDELEVYTSETDPNKLLGRPNQYTSKVNFKNGSVEVFENEKDVKARKEYIDSLGKATPMFAEYSYINGNVLLRIKSDITPEEAKKYEESFMKIEK